jgi:serine/threonine protein phosphatase 1
MSEACFVIPDIHGRLDLLENALTLIEQREPAGTVIFTGDYVDRGHDSRGVIERLIAGPPDGWRWVCLRGNHEDMMLETLRAPLDPGWWIGNGGGATVASYSAEFPNAHLDWIAALPRVWSDAHRVYVHAGVGEQYDLDAQPEQMTQWFRYPEGADIGYRGKHVVHGHTPRKNGPELYQHRTNLDTGAYATGRLCVGVFDLSKPGGPIEVLPVTTKEPTP